jgi:AbrB family looped-hinge helix DNA binding protein
MAKVSSKLQITLPKAIVERYSIRPGDEIDWTMAGDVICIIPHKTSSTPSDRDSRLRLYDDATERHHSRQLRDEADPSHDRGWTREQLYARGRSH